MNWLDYVLIAILALSALQSFRRGLSREIISLVAAIAALFCGMWFYASAGAYLRQWVSSDRAADFLGFLAVVVAVMMIGGLIGMIVRRFVKAVGLSFFDRLAGAVFGLIRGALVASALLTAWMAFGPHTDSKTAPAGVVHSQIAPRLLEASNVLVAVAPEPLKRSFREMFYEAKSEIAKLALSAGTSNEPGKK